MWIPPLWAWKIRGLWLKYEKMREKTGKRSKNGKGKEREGRKEKKRWDTVKKERERKKEIKQKGERKKEKGKGIKEKE